MSKFFINRPIVAMVIALLMVIAGTVSILQLPVAQYPNIVPPEIVVQATYVGADALTIEESVATPLEEQMSGVDNMNYMYSVNANYGVMQLHVIFAVGTDPNTDQVLTQLRVSQANATLPADVTQFGVTVQKSYSAPLMLVSLYSPKGTYDATFLTNYAIINMVDPLSRVTGVGRVQVFGGQYALRCWVKPDRLAQLGVTITDIVNAINTQNTVNPGGQIGGEPVPRGQEFTYTVRAQGRLETPDEFGEIVLRANPDGSVLRLRDVARLELAAQTYTLVGRYNGSPAAVIALYQLPGSNAVETANLVRKELEELRARFPGDVTQSLSLDTTQSVREGLREIVMTLLIAIGLVAIVVFVFLQDFRATLIPLAAVPVSLVGTFAVFPILGFSINTLSLFGLVLAIGLVVDDAIVVVEAVQRHVDEGMSSHDAAIKAMDEVQAPVVAIALILAAVFVPTAFVPGISGRLFQQFAVTIAVSVVFSAFNALTLSPALSAKLLRPKEKGRGGLIGRLFGGFNRGFEAATNGYIHISTLLIHRAVFGVVFLAAVGAGAYLLSKRVPATFIPQEDQGYVYIAMQLPNAASMQRSDAAARRVEEILKRTPGVESYITVVGFNLLSQVQATYNVFFFVTLKKWGERPDADAIQARLNRELSMIPQATSFSFPPPAIPGIGTSGGVTFILEDRGSHDVKFLADNTNRFLEAARKRPELTSLNTTLLADVPQIYVDVDRARVIAQRVNLSDVYRTLQSFMGGAFINYFNRFGRQWQVYVQADGEYRTNAQAIGEFYVRNAEGNPVPLTAVARIENSNGPEFTMRYNSYRAAQILATAAPGFSSTEAMTALEETFAATMPSDMGFDYLGISFQEQEAAQAVSPMVVFGVSLIVVFLILAAQYESWSLPFSVLLTLPIAVLGAFLALTLRGMENAVYVQIGLIMLIGLSAKNAILIVEFSKRDYESGNSIDEAALNGARVRFRPILMTSFAFIMGTIPLAIASGAGSVGRRILGTTVLGGMLTATVFAIFLIPAMFALVERITARLKGRKAHSGKAAPPAKASGDDVH
ncbi:MAG TPA: multidrug efflux RND transporter permease subunit [Gemmatimonadaceae bacterium]